MAKQLVGPVERHIEKAAVGIAGLLLIGVIARYLVTSPNRLDIGGSMVTPGTIDEIVAGKADAVGSQIRRAPLAELTFEPFYDQLLAGLDPFEAAQLSLEAAPVAPFGPAVPIIDTAEVIEGQRTLVEVLQLPKPVITHGRTMFDVAGVPDVRNWVTVSAVFDRREQANHQAAAYGAAMNEVVFGPVQLQRRARRTDGSWHEEDWELVDPWPAAERPSEPSITIIELEGQPAVDADEFNRIVDFGDATGEPLNQLAFLRPLMPERIVGTPWEFPIVTTYEDVIGQDDEFLRPEGGGSTSEIEDRYGLRDIEVLTEEAEELTGAARIDALFQSGIGLLGSARTEDEAIDAYNIFATIIEDDAATSSDKNRARRLRADANQKMKDIRRRIKFGGGEPDEEDDQEVRRVRLPTQQIWIHDAGNGSVASGRTYQYRLRVLLSNRLAGELAKFKNVEDATVVFIEGPWSEPSDPVEVDPDRQYFVYGCDARKQTVKIEMYLWFEGQWVTAKKAFEVGDRVVQTTRVQVPDLDDPEEIDRPEVRFDTGVSVVDIDFDRDYRARDTVRGGGVKFSTSSNSVCSVVLADEDGRLQERLVPRDKGDPAKRERARQVWKP